MHNDFTLFSRVVPSGKTVVYFYAYDLAGNRLGPWTTGQSNRTAARNYCNRLIREGRLLPTGKAMPTFEEYSQGWWNLETCAYLKDRKKRRVLTENYVARGRLTMNIHLIPYFGKMKLDQITPEVIEKWLDSVTAEKKDGKKGLKNTTANSYYAILMTMLRWAVKKKIIASDPTVQIQKLGNDRKELKIITRDEFKALFVGDWQKVWNGNRIMYTINKLAALSGMRISEVFGLKGEYVFDDHIYLCAQYDKYGYRPTKTKDQTNIPLPLEMIADLKELVKINGNGFLFSEDGGITPVDHHRTIKAYHRALINISMTSEEIKKRGLNLHAWRHFCNTELQKGGLTVKQVQAVTRHKSERMTEIYSHFNPSEFTETTKIQSDLLKPKNDKPEKPILSIVKLTDLEEKAS